MPVDLAFAMTGEQVQVIEALEDFRNYFIQSKSSASTHEYSESNRASKYVTLLSNFGAEENRGILDFNWYLFPDSSARSLNREKETRP